MSNILIVVEIQNGKIREASFELVTLARKLAEANGRGVKSLVVGSGVADIASDFAAKGGGETLVADDAALAIRSPIGRSEKLEHQPLLALERIERPHLAVRIGQFKAWNLDSDRNSRVEFRLG